jgi:hypothetical protein
MIHPRQQWCIQIEVTNACPRSCSNCTRMLAHVQEPFFVTVEQFEQAVLALKSFPTESEPCPKGRRKVVGMIGGEPLMHPEFPILTEIMARHIPPRHRGLWTGINWQQHKFAGAVDRFLEGGAYLNWNQHNTQCEHQPVLAAIQDIIEDEEEMWEIIGRCPLQADWSGTITPKGFFFCEVAGAMDIVFDGPGGEPVSLGCWKHDLDHYQYQIDRYCPRCGVCLPMDGRRDSENRDDMTESNIVFLRALGSPRVLNRHYVTTDVSSVRARKGWNPLRYLK